MAEGILGGILGEEDEKGEMEVSLAPASADAFAAAIAAKLAGNDPEVARKTVEFLDKQSQLLETQNAHSKDEHAARLHFLQGQAREVDIRRFGLRLRVGFQLFIAVVATVIAVGFAVLIRDAVTSRSVVIDSVEIAPNISAQVPSGKIVAAGLFDVLTRIQSVTRSNAEHRALSNAWTNDIAIDLPETGVSVGQIERIIKTKFGHDQHIEGDLTETPQGELAFTVRGNGILPKTFTHEGKDLDKLLSLAGEYVYRQSQPGLWAVYLVQSGRNEEALQFARLALPSAAPSERPVLLNTWADAITFKGSVGSMQEALAMYRESVKLKPDYWTGYSNIIFALAALGEEEAAVREGEDLQRAAGGRPGRAPDVFYSNYDQMVWDLQSARASNIVDIESHGGIGTTQNAGATLVGIAQYDVQLHDLDSAALKMTTTMMDEKDLPTVAAASMTRAMIAEERGDFKAAVKAWDEFAPAFANPAVSIANPYTNCYAAVAYEKAGQPAKADAALIPAVDANYVDCLRFKADVLDLRGDWQGAQQWYAKSVSVAPSIPSGYYSWGLALARRGDLAAAAAKFEEAHVHGPHWADPLKAWGDVLVKQGARAKALDEYDEALKFAPNWVELRAAREALAQPHQPTAG